MEILDLSLVNFRNFASKKFTFDPKITVIIGPNGSGKTNILEAISLLSGIRPGRIKTDLDLVKFDKSQAKIESKVESFASLTSPPERQSEARTLTINFQVIDEWNIKKSYMVDSFKKRSFDLSALVSIIIFEPRDLELVTGSPSLRRHHLDNLLSSVDREYHRSIIAYNKIIARRNKILQRIFEGKSKTSELDFWDERLLTHANYISGKREDFFEYLNFVEKGDLSWNLRQSLLSGEKLLRNRERDIGAGATLSGPHRDDFRFIFKTHDLELFGSRGEMRMAVLALKLAELEYMQVKRGMRPILALDDIFSELDWEHREAVLSAVDKQQTIITAAEQESLPKKILKKAKMVELR